MHLPVTKRPRMSLATDPLSTYEQVVSACRTLERSTDDFIILHVSSTLRRDLRAIKTEHPSLFYVAMGVENIYKLTISKTPIVISYNDLHPKVKERFAKEIDFKLEPYLAEESLDVIEPYIPIKRLQQLLLEAIVGVGGEKEWLNKHFSLPQAILDDIKSHEPAFSKWQQLEVVKKQLPINPRPVMGKETKNHRTTHYHKNNDRGWFVSLDLKAANFNVLRKHGLITEPDWTTFLSKFNPQPYFLHLKKLRLTSLSDKELLMAKQVVCWENVVIEVLERLIQTQTFSDEQFTAFNSDELLFRAGDQADAKTKSSAVRQLIDVQFPEWCDCMKVEYFQLVAIPQTNSYAKRFEDGKVEFKCVNPGMMLKVIESYNNMTL
uniref:Uncharacterized protein n=1 Tax=Clandestinovirus TaxID=2831644 RepID=A0A8F8PN35_9VIRU|nr:hypothetical protein KOM_12_173 [Clandestinovirus]